MALYLHFLDRELRSSVHAVIKKEEYRVILASVILCCYERLFSGISLLFETCLDCDDLLKALLHLGRGSYFQPISHHPTFEEFLATRATLYAHDANRYPAYFDCTHPELFGSPDMKMLPKPIGTTMSLASELSLYAQDVTVVESSSNFNDQVNSETVKSIINQGLSERRGRAITCAVFKNEISTRTTVHDSFYIRRLISEKYTKHYLKYLAADIITGLPGLDYYDYLAQRFPIFDFKVWKVILSWLLGPQSFNYLSWNLIKACSSFRGSPEHLAFVFSLRRLLRALTIVSCVEGSNDNIVTRRNRLLKLLYEVIGNTKGCSLGKCNSIDWINFCSMANNCINQTILLRTRTDGKFSDAIRQCETGEHMTTRILVCTATDVESRLILAHIKQIGGEAVPESKGSVAYWDIGYIHQCHLFLIQSQMGSGGSGGSALTIDDGIRAMSPDFVVSLGIAFGASSATQKLGDILISRQLQCYDLQRVGAMQVIPRGDKMPAHPALIARCDVGKSGWLKSGVHTGLVLSGDKLVDNVQFKKKLLKLFPEAIGGEMEGSGICAACYRRQVPWIVIKGICDWGENKTETTDQKVAANNAIDFFKSILVVNGWSNFSVQVN